MPNSLPFLPGNVYSDPTITRYHKTQLLDLKNGIITGKSFKFAVTHANFSEKTLALQEPINQDLLTNMRSTGGNTLKSTQRPKQENNAIPRVAPKWLKHDRQVSVLRRLALI